MITTIIKKNNNMSIVAKASLWFMFCSIMQKAIALLTTPIFTRLMSTTQFGQFTVYNSWLSIFTIVSTLRLNGAVFNKGMSKYKEDRDGYTSTMQTITFFTATCALVIYLLFRNQIDKLTELPSFVMILLFIELMFTPAIDFWTIRKRYDYIYKSVVARTLLMAVMNAGLGIIAVMLCSEKGYARIVSCIAVNLLFGFSLFVYNRKEGKIWFNSEYAKFAILFNLPLLLHYFSQYVLEQFDRIMIQKMVSISAAGIYGIAYSVGLLLRIITVSINNALVPWQYDQLEKKEFKKLDDTLFTVYIFAAGCALALSAFAPELMKILADEKYYEGVYCIPPVALALVFSFMYTTFANVEFFYDYNKFTMYISMAVAGLNVLLNYVFIKLFGYHAAAYTTLFCYVIFAAGHYIYMSKCVKQKCNITKLFNTKRLVLLSALVLAVGVFMISLYDYMLIRYAIILLAAIVAYYKRDYIKRTLLMIKKK